MLTKELIKSDLILMLCLHHIRSIRRAQFSSSYHRNKHKRGISDFKPGRPKEETKAKFGREYSNERYRRKRAAMGFTVKPHRKLSPEEIKAARKESRIRYCKRHSKKLKARWLAYYYKKYRTSAHFQMAVKLRTRIKTALKKSHTVKSIPTETLLGCSISEAKVIFESKFTEGMTWEKFLKGEIHIDHIVPCAAFDLSDPKQQRICFSIENIQPLWAVDNLRKHAKILSGPVTQSVSLLPGDGCEVERLAPAFHLTGGPVCDKT